jgi:HAD superfamily hydrolase (TIGR01509 family)
VTIRAVVLDVGETLVDETRAWGAWADHLGIPRLTFFAALGAVIARGEHHRAVFQIVRPGIDVDAEARAMAAVGRAPLISLEDLYPDALPTLRRLRAAGLRLGLAANQPADAAAVLAGLGVEFDLVGMSDAWGIEKPDPRFFERILSELSLPAAEVAYVGDRVDNDVRPAAAAGMVAVFVRRGPWAAIQAGRSDPPEAALVVGSLTELPDGLAAFG